MESIGKIKLPALGLGTRKGLVPDLIKSAILDNKYRLIDTAAYYKNESEIGEGLQSVFDKVPRNEICVVSKLWNDSKDDVEGALRASLKRLKLDYLDLYLVHWPIGVCVDTAKWKYKQPPLYKTWADMESCVRKGLCKAIGVSNFNCQLLLDLLSYAEIPPCANQIELHPYCVQRNLVKYCLANDIQPMAYGPLTASGRRKEGEINVLNNPIIKDLSVKYKKTPGQICLQWGMANGHVVIPQTSKVGRLKENMESMNFTIENDDLKKIDELDKNTRIYDLVVRNEFGAIPIFD